MKIANLETVFEIKSFPGEIKEKKCGNKQTNKQNKKPNKTDNGKWVIFIFIASKLLLIG